MGRLLINCFPKDSVNSQSNTVTINNSPMSLCLCIFDIHNLQWLLLLILMYNVLSVLRQRPIIREMSYWDDPYDGFHPSKFTLCPDPPPHPPTQPRTRFFKTLYYKVLLVCIVSNSFYVITCWNNNFINSSNREYQLNHLLVI